MLHGKKVVVVMPAYHAEKTLVMTYNDIPFDVVDEVVLVDDCSADNTVEVGRKLAVKNMVVHEKNKGYGGNQKTCYTQALKLGADIVVMVPPDYQYAPRLITAMASMIASGEYDCVLASRVLGTGALRGGMPLYKYISNRFLTLAENPLLGEKISEYHTGYRAFSKEVLETLPLNKNSNNFVFDNQMLAQTAWVGFRISEIHSPTQYFEDASSINFKRSVIHGFGV